MWGYFRKSQFVARVSYRVSTIDVMPCNMWWDIACTLRKGNMEEYRRSRHIVFINAGEQVSGAERVLLDLAQHAAALGDRVTVISPAGALSEQVLPPLRHVTAPLVRLSGGHGLQRVRHVVGLPFLWISSAKEIRKVSGDADTIIVNSTFALPAVGLAFPRHSRTRGGPVISWLVHDTITSLKQRVVAKLGAHALTKAVAVSEVTAASVRPLVDTVLVQPNGVEVPPEVVTVQRNQVPTIGILAAITGWKGHDILLEAVALLPDVHLDIAGAAFTGSEDFEAALRERARQPDLQGRVHFLGHVNKQDVFPKWSALISASTSPEAGPLGVLEAMSYGVPVVATNHGGAAEYLYGGAGILVAPSDPQDLANGIRLILENPEHTAQITTVARERVIEHHNLAHTRERMLEVLN